MRKTLKELTFKDNFLFAAAMLESDNCRLVIERILEKKIERVEVQVRKQNVPYQDGMNDYGDSLVKTLQTSIRKIKRSREMEDRYMTLEQLIKDKRKEAKTEALF